MNDVQMGVASGGVGLSTSTLPVVAVQRLRRIVGFGERVRGECAPFRYQPTAVLYNCTRHKERTMPEKFLERIEVNPAVMLGKPVIKGTRIPIELLLRKLSEGATEADLMDAYPRLTKIDIQAALAYAASALAHEMIVLPIAA